MSADNRVKETQRTFQADSQAGAPAKRYRAKVFKSGNSLALRLPAELGLQAGMEMDLEAVGDGVYTFKLAAQPKRKIDVSGFAGKAPGIKLAPREDFDERPSTIAARKAAGLA
jgi:antitoxin VapB